MGEEEGGGSACACVHVWVNVDVSECILYEYVIKCM